MGAARGSRRRRRDAGVRGDHPAGRLPHPGAPPASRNPAAHGPVRAAPTPASAAASPGPWWSKTPLPVGLPHLPLPARRAGHRAGLGSPPPRPPVRVGPPHSTPATPAQRAPSGAGRRQPAGAELRPPGVRTACRGRCPSAGHADAASGARSRVCRGLAQGLDRRRPVADAGHVTPSTPTGRLLRPGAPAVPPARDVPAPSRSRPRGACSAVAWAALPRRAVGLRAAEPPVSGARVLGGRPPAVRACPRAASEAGADSPAASGGRALASDSPTCLAHRSSRSLRCPPRPGAGCPRLGRRRGVPGVRLSRRRRLGGLPRASPSRGRPAAAGGLQRTCTASPRRRLVCGLHCACTPRRPPPASPPRDPPCRGRGHPDGLQETRSTRRPSCAPCASPRLRHGRPTRDGGVAARTRQGRSPGRDAQLVLRDNATAQPFICHAHPERILRARSNSIVSNNRCQQHTLRHRSWRVRR